jgi:hypothetical protein
VELAVNAAVAATCPADAPSDLAKRPHPGGNRLKIKRASSSPGVRESIA